MRSSIQLNRDLIEQIIFGMENQENSFYLDLSKVQVVSIERLDQLDEKVHIPLPPWKPSDGFILMERFATSINNPLYQEELKQILHTGKGVFRNFKNLLKQHKELERSWFRFKQKEMINLIREWLERYEDFLELSELGDELDYLDDLISSDFILKENPEQWLEIMRELDSTLWNEMFPDYPETYHRELNERYRRNGGLRIDEENHILALQDLKGNLSSFLWYCQKKDLFLLRCLYTLEDYRGIGLATQLMKLLRETMEKTEASILEIAPVPHDARTEHLLSSIGLIKGPGSFIIDFSL